MKHIIIIISIFFFGFVLPYIDLFAETNPPCRVQLPESVYANQETVHEKDSTNNKYPDSVNIHNVDFQKYLDDRDSECTEIDSSYKVTIISILYSDLSKDGKDEAVVTAQTCMMGNGGPDIHSVFYMDTPNNVREYKIDYESRKNTKTEGIPMDLIGNRNYFLTVKDGILCADYWDGSGRKQPLRQYFRFENGKFILDKEVYGETFHTSFDCSKARSDREIVACSCDSIAEMDLELSNLYKQLESKLDPDEKNKLEKEQQQWLNDFDKVTAYRWLYEFSDGYKKRIEELKKMLAGVK